MVLLTHRRRPPDEVDLPLPYPDPGVPLLRLQEELTATRTLYLDGRFGGPGRPGNCRDGGTAQNGEQNERVRRHAAHEAGAFDD